MHFQPHEVRMGTTQIVLAMSTAAVVAGCTDITASPESLPLGTPVPVQLTVGPSADTLLSGMALTVTGRGIQDTLVFVLAAPDTVTTTTTLTIPAGPAHFFTAKGYTGHVQSYEDTLTADVTRSGLALQFDLKKLTGSGTIESSIEEFSVAVDDSTAFREEVADQSAQPGSTLDYTVRVTYRNASAETGGYVRGDAVPDAVVSWASTNPGVVTVGITSCTTGLDGTCSITADVNSGAEPGQSAGVVASHKGIAHRVTVTVP